MRPFDRIEGPSLILRLITPQDAGYIYSLRTDPAYNRHLSEMSGTVEDQRRWINSYKTREGERREYYYMIERKDGQFCGVVRLYDIDTISSQNFTWGSWILAHNKPPKAALASACLVYSIAFDYLGFQRAIFDVRRDNQRALKFHKRFGAQETQADDNNVFFVYTRERFEADRAAHHAVVVQSLNELEQ